MGTTFRKRRPRTFAKILERALKWTLVFTLGLALAWTSFSVLRKLVKPFRLYVAEAGANRGIEREIDALKKENEELRQLKPYLRTPEGAADRAREQGWVKPGEQSLMVEPEKKDAKARKRH
jgi:hypothetical protein